jgi:hypothetical protein
MGLRASARPLVRPELLTDKIVIVLAGSIGTQVTAGAVANR